MTQRGGGDRRGGNRNQSFIEKLKNGEKKLQNTRDAQQLFNQFSKKFDDPGRLTLMFNEKLVSVLQHATQILHPDITEPLKLLQVMGGEEALNHGIYKSKMLSCYRGLYNSEDFNDNLLKRLSTGRSRDHDSTVAWFLLQLGKDTSPDSLDLRSNPTVLGLIDILKTSTQQGFPELSKQLAVVFSESKYSDGHDTDKTSTHEEAVVSLKAAKALMRPPGVRSHDNDKKNFRDISIIPTTRELECDEDAFLPSVGSDHIVNQEAATLDRLFRLMREDLIGTVKEELQSEFKIPPAQRKRTLVDPRIVGFGMKPVPHIVVRVPVPSRLLGRIKAMDNNAAQAFFDSGPGKRVLQNGTLVLVVHKEKNDETKGTDKSKIAISCVGTVVERRKILQLREIPGTKRKMQVLEVGVMFTPESMTKVTKLLRSLKDKKNGVGLSSNGGLFNASAGLFSLEPILKALMKMDRVPMSDQLVALEAPTTPTVAHGGRMYSELSNDLQDTVSSDLSQKVAMEETLKSNIVLVQGPPGTGKTYVGVQMVKAMLELEEKDRSNPPLRILCLCYTNHALDSFLLDLIDAGISNKHFVRLGSSSKIDSRIKSRCLGEISSDVDTKFGRNENAVFGTIKRESEDLEKRFDLVWKKITENSNWGSNEKWWDTISTWFEDESEYYDVCWQWKVPETVDQDGFKIVAKGGGEIKNNYLWERWSKGLDRGVFNEKDVKPSAMWELSKDIRTSLIEKWNEEWLEPQAEILHSTMASLLENAEALRNLRQRNDLRLLKNAKIIGCTTVAAAKYQGMINPTVVVVEEAGEILEAHILANLGVSCKQLIMIGDHKQLRPKIDNYRLQKESKNGFDANVSLFERLVVATGSKISVIPLTIQHRMRPEISRIIRAMGLYDELKDHPKTFGRKNVTGVLKDVVFVDHLHPENQDEESALVGTASKVNLFEVDMVVNIANYIIQQGQYSMDQVTILTPYLGQLSLIQKKLEEFQIGSLISDKDFGELARQNLNSNPDKVANHNYKIRVATVDNFQGEESHIVIISLVRSNPQFGKIGFLTSEERVNVLFSRAREGMYIVGNLTSLAECASKGGRELWSNLKLVMEHENNVLDHFPVTCQKHKTTTMIRTPEDFGRLVPDGGCELMCSMVLPCTHTCPLHCHGHLKYTHSLILCKEKVSDICSNGHAQLRTCHDIDFKCSKYMVWNCPRGHTLLGVCYKGRPHSCISCKLWDEKEDDARKIIEARDKVVLEKEQEIVAIKVQVSTKLKIQKSDKQIALMEKERVLAEKDLYRLSLETTCLPPTNSLKLTTTTPTRLKDDLKDIIDGESVSISNLTSESMKVRNPSEITSTQSLHRESNSNINVENEPAELHDPPTVTLAKKPYSKSESIKNLEKDSLVKASDSSGHTVLYKHYCLHIDCRDSIRSFKTLEAVQQHMTSKHKNDDVTPIGIDDKTSMTGSLSGNPDFCDAMDRFNEKEFLVADDLLENCLSSTLSVLDQKTLGAFRYIIHDQLDPSSELWVGESYVENRPPSTFDEAIQCWASFISLSCKNHFPFIAKEHAEYFLSFSMCDSMHSIFNHGKVRATSVANQARSHLCSTSNISSDKIEIQKVQSAWNDICNHDKTAPTVVNDEVMKMTGLIEIKRAFVNQYNLIRVAQKQDDTAASSYNVRFEGNPGTGKTTIARHYGLFLQQLGVLPKESISIEVTAASLINKGVSYLEEQLEKIKKTEGGVLFIDEAYQLSEDKIAGTRILDFMLPHAESLDGEFGKLVWILAGYSKKMEKLFEHNEGLPSRFPQRFVFADYTRSELESIFKGFMLFKNIPKSTKLKKQEQQEVLLKRKRTAYHAANDAPGTNFKDNFGNTWNYDGSNWHDDYGNSTGYHPRDIGSNDNPIASPNGQLWTRSGSYWLSNTNERQTHYPSSPNPSLISNAKKILRNPAFTCDDKFIRIAMRRLAQRANQPGFGNARDVRKFFDIVRERLARRITQEKLEKHSDLFQFTQRDLLGVAMTEKELKSTEAYENLNKMEGLVPVKEQVDLLITLAISNAKRELAEKPTLDVVLNRVFVGNPGTGKTSVAKIYGQLLTEMGLLSKGEVIVKNPSDFKGDVLGSSEKATRNILRAAEGNVLVIDEAYALCTSNSLTGTSDIYGTAVIDTLVEQIQAQPGDDRAVVMLGYRKEMEEMFKNVNPGLARRFQMEHAYEFPDYNDSALLKILIAKAKKSCLSISIPVAKRAVRSLAKNRAKPNFGNGGAVDSLLSEAKQRMQKRDGTADELELEDFAIGDDRLDEGALDALFDDMVGMDNIRNQLVNLKSLVQFAKSRGENPALSINFNYLFLGNPGTGKTTIAKRMGTMFKILGLLPDDEVYECSPKDFATGFVGQAGQKTAEIMKKSRGGVLFIDEAYQLNPNRGGHYMTEAVDELCAKLTDDDFKGKLLVILAGYDTDMDEMLSVNPGLKSRFADRINFDNLDNEATRSLLTLKLVKKGIPLSIKDSQSAALLGLASVLVKSSDFSNGRDVETVSNRTYNELAKRKASRNSNATLVDVENAIMSLLSSRQVRVGGKECATSSCEEQAMLSSTLISKLPSKSAATVMSTSENCFNVDEMDKGEDMDKVEDTVNDVPGKKKDENLFNNLNAEHLSSLQDIVEKMGLNTKEGVKALLDPSYDDTDLINELIHCLAISEDNARDILSEWREAHRKLKKQKLKSMRKGMEAIWHCAVCGCGGQPQPVCYVAPYISSYRSITL